MVITNCEKEVQVLLATLTFEPTLLELRGGEGASGAGS